MAGRTQELLERLCEKLDQLIELLSGEPPRQALTLGRRRTGQPWKHRPHHRAFYRLSPAARQRAVEGFRANQTTTAIAAAMKAEHGETIPVASLNRYREWWETTAADASKARAQLTLIGPGSRRRSA